jgi:myo-inositol 2-dehydrogenase/D-chiro-inositol 1-dehydrogenase
VSEAFRLALVGAGRMGLTHARALEGLESVRLTAVVEPVDEAAARVPALRRFHSVEELVDVDGVLVAVPTRLHVEIVKPLLRAGLPVLCEKPCGLTPDEAREIQRAGGVLCVALWRRFVPSLIALRARIARGELGVVSHVLCSQWDERPPPAAFRDPASSGGILVDMGVHEFDLLRWLTAQEIDDVCGFASTVTSEPPVPGDPESVSLAARLSGGATALVTLGRRHVPGEVHRVEVIGTEGAERLEVVPARGGQAVIDDALRRQAAAFATAARGGAWTGASIADAIGALDAAEAGTGAVHTRCKRRG